MTPSLAEVQVPRLMTVEEIEASCRASESPECVRYLHDAVPLPLETKLFPLGFPLLVRTNSADALHQCRMKWGMFEQEFDTEPMETQIQVEETNSRECPPAPSYHVMDNILLVAAGPENVCAAQFPTGKTRMVVSSAAVAHPSYFSQTFLEAAPACQIGTRLTTPIHAACVALGGRGVLLCGDSGAGKTSLAYACACAGWQFISDDTSYLLHNEKGRRVIGNCHHVRFRPSAAEIFPEIAGAEITPRMFGKPSIELRTSIWPEIDAAREAQIDFLVFLNRRTDVTDLRQYRRDVARYYMRQVLFRTRESRPMQYAAIERMLSAEVLEMRYQSLDWAVDRLERLVRRGN